MKYVQMLAVMSLGWLVVLGLRVDADAASEYRTVHLTITVKRANGDPVPDAPLCARSKGAQSGAATDQQGTAVIDLTAAPDEEKIAVQIAAGCDPFHGSLRRFREITDSTAVQSVYWVDVPAGATSVILAITLGDAVFVTGRVVDGTGTPVTGASGVRGSPSVSIWKPGDRFRLPVRAGTPAELFFVADGGRVKDLPIGPSSESLDLGDVPVLPLQGDATVRITLTDADKVDHRLELKGGGIALISSDGASVFTYMVKGSLVVAKHATEELPRVPAGTYYVTPGLFGNSLSFKVLDAVLNGVDVNAAGVPKIVAVAGQETALSVNVPQAEAAIRALEIGPQGGVRSVEVSVTLHSPSGQAIPGIPVCVRGQTNESGAATNQQGIAMMQVLLQADETRLALTFEGGCVKEGVSFQSFMEMVSSLVVDPVYWVDIPSGATSAATTITLGEAAFITGRLVDVAPNPQRAVGRVRGMKTLVSVEADGRFRFPVRKGVNSELYFIRDGSPVKIVPVAARNEDLELGDVRMPLAQGNAAVRITMTEAGQVDQRLEDKCLGISLVSADGSTVLSFLTKDGLAVANYGTGELPNVPAGTFYVAPGMFGNSLSFKVLDAVRNGVDLNAAGVPKIVAVAGQETALSVDVPQAEAAIRAIAASPQGR